MAKKSEDRRRSILNAALDEFEAKGFSAALVEDIAHRAGVSKGTIYGYFKGKEALLLGLAEEVAVLIQKEFDQPSEHASLPLIERLWRTEAGSSPTMVTDGWLESCVLSGLKASTALSSLVRSTKNF